MSSRGLFQTVASAAQGDPLDRFMAYLTRYVSVLVPATAHAFIALHAVGPPMEARRVVLSAHGALADQDVEALRRAYREVERSDPYHPARWDGSRAILVGTPEVVGVEGADAAPYATDFLAPLGLGPQLVLYLRDRLRVVGLVSVLRGRDDADFTTRDRRALLLCHPMAQYSFALARRVAAEAGPGTSSTSSLALTARERDVLELLAQGGTNEAIARTLSLSPETVKTHLSRLYRKFGVRNRTELVIRVLDEL